jgi:hypothetical protein
MTEPSLIRRERESLRDLIASSAERARAEVAVANQFQTRMTAFEAETSAERARIEARHDKDKTATDSEIANLRHAIQKRHATEHATAIEEHTQARKRAIGVFNGAKKSAQEGVSAAKWEAGTIFDASMSGAAAHFKEVQANLTSAAEMLAQLRAEATGYLARSRMARIASTTFPATEPQPSSDETLPEQTPVERLANTVEGADEQLARLERLLLPRFFHGLNVAGLFLFLGAATTLPAVFYLGPRVGGIVGGIATVLLGGGTTALLYVLARRQAAALWPPLNASLAHGDVLLPQGRDWVTAEEKRRREEIKVRRDSDVRKAERAAATKVEQAEKKREATLQQVEEAQRQRLEEVQRRRDEALQKAEAAYTRKSAEVEEAFQSAFRAWEENDRKTRDAIHAEHEKAWTAMATRWQAAMQRLEDEVEGVNVESTRLFPHWDDAMLSSFTPPADAPPALRFGHYEVDRLKIAGGIPGDPRLRGFGPMRFTLPSFLPFPYGGSLMLTGAGSARAAAVEVLRAVMLRMLTSCPAGKVRFTIFDPVGLGQNFAAFMHLADYEEALVTNRIWTESSHFEQRLADLTEHMEKVIQKYLRNEFASIQEYNANAGEVAEPFRVLVVANFPTNFNELSAKRLASVMQSGPRCGVYTLLALDPTLGLPAGVTMADFEPFATRLTWRDGQFAWKDPDFGVYPLELDVPPPDELLTRLLHVVGAKAKEAGRVEVPFEIIAPPEDQFWTSDSSRGIDVPLGRVGANKLHHMRLGQGTSQHVLIAGRTGSGKSTLLHALITNSALRYSPDQVELYLIDFKKGVEFKTYAAFQLPHARVVAIESEREFGLSVLQRLDEELRRRGERFRELNVQDLAGFREADPKTPLPRIMLIVDEFQEFFVEDDKLAQEAALLLDRLVRQGRAFGIHIQLGSQTLGGAFSLARSTLGQMAVRIALQCSEADAHLILSEENSAARLLSRPGEAIYNDANGLLEGNHFFQVVWLSDERKEMYLKRIQELERQRNGRPRPQIIFEGNIPADIDKNFLLRRLIEAETWPAVTKAPQAWLGDAVAIKDPTAAIFRRQSGSSLLIIGQNDEAARGIFLSALTSLAVQYTPERARFVFLDGTLEESPQVEAFARDGACFPHSVQVADWRVAGARIAEVAEEVERRQAAGATDEPAIFLFIYDLARFRDLRKAEDDFSFRRDEKPSPGKQFANILREGPGYGVHVLVWCDSLNNLNRSFERSSLREFEMRVLFQMSPNDSSTLIDSPAAGRLGANRAFYSSEEQGKLEKFRPYGLPPESWWQDLRERLQARLQSTVATG